ncbi:MAG: dienelactone hydrolase family protein [Candidatus Thermoplasmatota archaeon]|nr:dienelactone hydrolase family protein [Candidatus Thermoplasmatota archaeon]
MQRRIVSFAIVLLIFLAGALFAGCVEEQPPAEKTTEELAVEIVALLMEQQYTDVYGYFNTSIRSQITASQFQSLWEQQVINTYGTITGIIDTRPGNESGYQTVYVTCSFSQEGSMDVKMIFDAQKWVLALTVVPTEVPYMPPSYVNQSLFMESMVTVGSGGWALPGTLTIPKGTGPFPAVVLVHGSGPNDQDETIGPNTPFKDLAWGLATQGIVVLRYEKRTKQYPKEVTAMLQNFTVQEETIDDAIAAVSVLYTLPVVNQSQIYVLGHSLGGMLAPRIASQDHRIAGLIILAGNTRPLEDLILEQTWYLANLSGTNQSDQIAQTRELVQKIKILNFSDDELVFNAPKSYWADLVGYDPVATAETLGIPLFILQGLRDYQVTMDDFSRWNQTFYANQSVLLKTYPSLNHLFLAGTGTPTNTEYMIPGHVDEQVLLDIASWISQQGTR